MGPSPIRRGRASSACPSFQCLRHGQHLIVTTLGGDVGIIPVVQMRERRPREGTDLPEVTSLVETLSLLLHPLCIFLVSSGQMILGRPSPRS